MRSSFYIHLASLFGSFIYLNKRQLGNGKKVGQDERGRKERAKETGKGEKKERKKKGETRQENDISAAAKERVRPCFFFAPQLPAFCTPSPRENGEEGGGRREEGGGGGGR